MKFNLSKASNTQKQENGNMDGDQNKKARQDLLVITRNANKFNLSKASNVLKQMNSKRGGDQTKKANSDLTQTMIEEIKEQ